MKATGIVRRVDQLGRIVIPKELRRSIGIQEGDPMEIYVDEQGIILRKYDCTANVADAIEKLKQQIEQDEYLLNPKAFKTKIAELEALIAKVDKS